jgi:hypothetical protein
MYDDASFVLPEECAARMGITEKQVVDLVRRGVLRARDGLVQPAILSGAR